MAIVSLLDEEPELDERRVREGLEGQPLPVHRLPQHREGRPRVRCRPRHAGAVVIPAAFDYVRADSAEEAIVAAHRARRRSQAARRWALAAATDEVAARDAVGARRRRSRARSLLHQERGDEIAIGSLVRHHDARDTPSSCTRRCRCSRTPRTRSVTRRCVTAARWAERSRTAIRRPTFLRSCSRSAARSSRRARTAEREIAATDFFEGFLETALAPDEMLVEIRVPKIHGAGWSFQKFNRRAQDWAIVGVAAVGNGDHRRRARQHGLDARCGHGGRGRGRRVARRPTDAAALAAEGTDPPSDLNASPEFRRHLATVLVRRALEGGGQ